MLKNPLVLWEKDYKRPSLGLKPSPAGPIQIGGHLATALGLLARQRIFPLGRCPVLVGNS